MTEKNQTITRRQALRSTAMGLGGVSAFALLPACTTASQSGAVASTSTVGAGSAGADALLEQIAWNLLEHNPGSATAAGVDTGDKAYLRSRLGGSSPEAMEALANTLRSDIASVRAFPKEELSPDQLTSMEVVESAYATALDGLALPYGDIPVGGWRNTPYVVAQNVGAYIDMPRFFSATHPLREASDVEAYLSRLSQVPAVLNGELVRMQEARAIGVIPPDFILDKAITQMELTLTDAMEAGSLLEPLLTSELPAATTASRQAKQIITEQIAPALEEQLAELLTARRQAHSKAGIWAQPQGDEWYNWVLKAATTTNLTPDEIHEQGLAELEDLHAQMDPILREIGYTSGTVGERMQALSLDPRYQFSEGDAGRKEIFAFISEQVDWIKAQMPRAFNTLVDPPLEVRRIPITEELGAPGAYGGAGSKDGSIPGRFWINLRSTDLHRKYDLPDLTFHETIPGHVWEGEYSNRLPLIRTLLSFGVFSEGWALYGEQMADELGAYDEFKVGRLGYLQSLAFRACRLVVDTGLHHKRWTREQGQRFFVERNGSKLEEVRSEVDRYCSWAGQACSYKIGHSEIVRQRGRAETAMGSGYDFKAFNDAVILAGNTPLDVLGKNVDRYIATNSQ